MANNLDSVKTAQGEEGRGYHHGALRDALLDAAEAILAEKGVEGFSLREAARRVGVSPAAPAHHFGDSRGLLTALAAKAFQRFGDGLQAADEASGTRAERLRAQGEAYVEFALSHPALFHLMWRRESLDTESEELRLAGRRAFGFLQSAVEGREARPVKRLPSDPIDPRTMASWSMVHGFAVLVLGGALGPPGEETRQRAMQLLPLTLKHLVP